MDFLFDWFFHDLSFFFYVSSICREDCKSSEIMAVYVKKHGSTRWLSMKLVSVTIWKQIFCILTPYLCNRNKKQKQQQQQKSDLPQTTNNNIPYGIIIITNNTQYADPPPSPSKKISIYNTKSISQQKIFGNPSFCNTL